MIFELDYKITKKLRRSLEKQFPPHIEEINGIAKISEEDAALVYSDKNARIIDLYESWIGY